MKSFSEFTQLSEGVRSKKTLSSYAKDSYQNHKKIQVLLKKAINSLSQDEDIASALIELMKSLQMLSNQARNTDEILLKLHNNGK